MFEDKLLIKHEKEKDLKAGKVRMSDALKKDARNKKLAIRKSLWTHPRHTP